MNYEEHQLQKSICQLLDIALPDTYRYFAVPNGGWRNPKEAARLKAEGVKAGVPDICIVSQDGWVAFVEVKRPRNSSLSDPQKEWRDFCTQNFIPWGIAKSLDDVLDLLKAWGIKSLVS